MLILWDDGIGSIDMGGTVTGVFYNDETMQAADEGAAYEELGIGSKE